MSDSPGTVEKPESGQMLPKMVFDDIIVLANSLLDDECPLAQFEDWLFPIDDNLLALKLWAKSVGVEHGLLENIVRNEDLCAVVGQILRDVITPLQDLKRLCGDPETLTSLEVQATVSAAIDQFHISTGILTDNVNSTLADTIGLFQKFDADANKTIVLHNHKPIGTITDSPHEKRDLGIPDHEPSPRTKSSFNAFIDVLKEMSPKEGQAIRFGELPILRRQLLIEFYSNRKRDADDVGEDSVYTEDEITAVAVILAQFHDAWLETVWTTFSTTSNMKPKVDCIPHMARIWLILREMGREHLLDYFCESQKTDESLPLDILTLERILPLDLYEDAAIFARSQSRLVPRSRRNVADPKRLDVLVWNQTEVLLSPAEADVLEIFDCCYAGHIGRTKGHRSFEYVAATDENGFTKVPGKDSFTSALIYALKTLVNERENGRFTTVELLNKINSDAPHFPNEQNPMLFKREKRLPTGRIMLHQLQKAGSDDDSLRKETENSENFTGTTLTLHYDFIEKPSQAYIEMFGKELNDFFERNVSVNRVRWGGIRQSMVARAANKFRRAGLERVRRKSTINSNTRLSTNKLDPPTPYSSDQHSPQPTEPGAIRSPSFNSGDTGTFNSADTGTVSLLRPSESNDEDESQGQGHRGRRKRRRITLHSESS